MVKDSKQKSTSKMPIGRMLLLAIIWPILLAFLVHSNLLNNLLSQSADIANLTLNLILLIPAAIVLFPIAYRIDVLYMTRPMKIAKWLRILLSIPATALGLWVVWYIFLFTSLSLGY